MKRNLLLISLILLSLIPLLDLLTPGLPLTHDGIDHVARIANFYQNLREGSIIPRWAMNLNWGYGHPILMFLYPFSSYVASAFHFFGASLVDSTKLVFAVTYIASGVTMYIWLQTFLNKKAAFIGGLAYVFAPYRFVDLYVRGAIGEHVAFLFLPLLCYAIYSLAVSKKSWGVVVLSLSSAGLLLSHNAISLMFFPILLLYVCYLYFTQGRKLLFLLKVFSGLVLGFLLAAFFWVPAFFEGKYTLRDIVTGDEYRSRFETWTRFLYSPWSFGGTGQFSVQIGAMQWVGVLLAPVAAFTYYKKKNRLWLLCVACLVIFFITLFMMTKSALPLWEAVTVLQKFQFPWRLLTIATFLSALLLALFVYSLKERKQTFSIVLVAVLLLYFNKDYWHAKGFSHNPESYYTGVYNGTTDTGESAPIWSVRFMEHRAKAQSYAIEGQATVKVQAKDSIAHTYEIVAEKPSRILENTLYFPGWKVFVNGNEVPTQFQDERYRGLITYNVPQGKNSVDVRFSETKLRFVADILSLCGFVLLTLYTLYLFLPKLWRRFR